MKRVRNKETIGNNNLQCITRSKKRREIHENDSVSNNIPTDLIIEILTKLPARFVAKLIIVSKLWFSIIRNKYFTELYLTRSSTRPRLLLSVYGRDMQFFHLFSQIDPSSDHHKVTTTLWSKCYGISPPVRGLICCRNDTKVMIGNPSTGQFFTSPRVKTRRKCVYTFFGYDPVNDVYKVLCMTVLCFSYKHGSQVMSEEHQVFTLGAKQKTWRMIQCQQPHVPSSKKELCMNGVVYYFAWINISERSLISFDLATEDFNVIKLPEDVKRSDPMFGCNLVNRNGNIVLTRVSHNGTLELWDLNDVSKQWYKVSFVVPSWADSVGNTRFIFRGATSTGEFIFAPSSFSKPLFLLYYDLFKEKNVRKVVIEGIGDDYSAMELFSDHVESTMFLSNVS